MAHYEQMPRNYEGQELQVVTEQPRQELQVVREQPRQELQVVTEQPSAVRIPADLPSVVQHAPIHYDVIDTLVLDHPVVTNGDNDCWHGCLKRLFRCCCRYDCVSDMLLYEAISRYEEEFILPVNQFVEKVTQNRFIITILESLYKSFPEFFFTYLPTGSLREGFGKLIPSTSVLATDYDMMLVPDAVTVGEYGSDYTSAVDTPVFTAIDAPKDHLAGYLWLKLEDKYLTQWEKLCLRRHVKNEGCSLLSSSKWREVLKDTIQKCPGIKDTTQRHYNEPESNIQVLVENNGPALTVDVFASHPRCCQKEKEKRRFFYADFTLGLHCVHWPKRADGFFTSQCRQNWPSQKVVDLIKKLGCHVVPKSSTQTLIKLSLEQEECTTFGRSPGLEWRYSFSQPEIILSSNIPRAARTAFLAFKAVVKRHFNKRFGKIPSYALKCIMYRVVELLPKEFWDGDVKYTVEAVFIGMLFRLRECLNRGYCANYWIPSINLFDKLREMDLISKRALMAQVYENPKKFVADPWLEYVRYVRLNCCYCGKGYNTGYIQIVEVLKKDSDACVCCHIKCSYQGNECPCCSSFTYRNDPLSLDVY